jgi:hypothetical protein
MSRVTVTEIVMVAVMATVLTVAVASMSMLRMTVLWPGDPCRGLA